MSDKKDRPVEELSAYERWELPTIAGGKLSSNSFSNKPIEPPKPPTAEELEEIRQAAYQEGLQQGLQDGLASGAEQGLAQGLEEGRKQGFDQGLQQGLDQARTQINQQINQIQAMLQQLADPVAVQQEQVAQAMSNMATAIARSVVHRELQLDPSTLTQLAQDAIDTLPSDVKRVSISAHPSDHSLFEQALEGTSLPVQLLADASIHVGGCVISTNTQLIDYTVEKRFQRSIHSMLMSLSAQQDQALVESPKAIESMGDFPSEVFEDYDQNSDQIDKQRNKQSNQQSDDLPAAQTKQTPSDAPSASSFEESEPSAGEAPLAGAFDTEETAIEQAPTAGPPASEQASEQSSGDATSEFTNGAPNDSALKLDQARQSASLDASSQVSVDEPPESAP